MSGATISVLGCGWLGLPLAEKLILLGYKVKGSTTTPAKLAQMEAFGIEPFLLSFPENCSKTILTSFLSSDVLVFNLPPSKSASESASYEQVLQKVLEAAPASLAAVIFVSSTSVYPDLNREVYEIDAIPSADAPSLLLRCENLVQLAMPGKVTIVRFGGLIGGSRHPGRFLAGKTGVSNPGAPVNMIHLTDCINILTEIIDQGKWGFVFNACAPVHPSRKAFYSQAAQQVNLVPPLFNDKETNHFKVINSDFLQQEVKFSFNFPDPISCLSDPNF